VGHTSFFTTAVGYQRQRAALAVGIKLWIVDDRVIAFACRACGGFFRNQQEIDGQKADTEIVA